MSSLLKGYQSAKENHSSSNWLFLTQAINIAESNNQNYYHPFRIKVVENSNGCIPKTTFDKPSPRLLHHQVSMQPASQYSNMQARRLCTSKRIILHQQTEIISTRCYALENTQQDLTTQGHHIHIFSTTRKKLWPNTLRFTATYSYLSLTNTTGKLLLKLSPPMLQDLSINKKFPICFHKNHTMPLIISIAISNRSWPAPRTVLH